MIEINTMAQQLLYTCIFYILKLNQIYDNIMVSIEIL